MLHELIQAGSAEFAYIGPYRFASCDFLSRRLTEPMGPSGSEVRRSLQATGARRSRGSKWPGAGRRGKLTEPKGTAAKNGGRGEANRQLLRLWLYDL